MKRNVFIIKTKNTHYVIGNDENGILQHIYWGKKIEKCDYSIIEVKEKSASHTMLDCMKEEYTPFGGAMYRNCAFKCEYFDKCRDSAFLFDSAKEGEGFLDITLVDKTYDISIILSYRYSDDTDIITRYATILNNSDKILNIDKIMSAELNFPGNDVYDVINTNGSWIGEFQTETMPLKCGTITFESRKGTTGHTNSPFIILSQNATEDYGNVYFAALGYSGNFKVEVQRDFSDKTRAMLGISDFDFSYILKPGERFITPKVYLGYSNGFTSMSNMMNEFAIKNILPKEFADKPLPVLYNSWEATGFNVNCNQQLTLAKIAKEIGCELFVIDDGWFGLRNNDKAGLGDWFVNLKKFPNGLGELIDEVNSLGMDFGLWFEPEMVQQDSNLYRIHPDWIYHYDTREKSELRNQLVLNLTKPEVKKYVFESIDKLLEKYNIHYIKWDMNRPLSEIGAENLENQQEIWYRHTMAVYDIVDKLKEKYPYLQIEACSSGGGRAELGAMEHFDMIWTSDNTDPVARLDIQKGYSFLYPIKCMRAWVTDMNSESRPVSLDFRFNVSMQGSLSIGANLLKYTDEELRKCKSYISFYKSIRNIIQFGNLYRLKNYKNDEFYATQYVSKDKNKSVVFINSSPNYFFNKQFKTIKLKGLDEEAIYKLTDGENEIIKSGGYFNNMEYEISFSKPLDSKIWVISKV